MKCTDKTIKDFLPAYLEQGLDLTERQRVEGHLGTCEDCSTELSLLRMMSEEPVPDPGEAFWASMPGRVSRAAAAAKNAKKGTFDLSWLWGRFILPRWAWAASGIGIVLVISWFALQSPQKSTEPSLSQKNDFSDEIMLAVTSDSDSDTIHLGELDRQDLATVDSWAGKELASIAQDVDQAVVLTPETDISEELAELDAGEMDRLSTMLTQGKEEG
jgi:anti-sigma factor RsiW